MIPKLDMAIEYCQQNGIASGEILAVTLSDTEVGPMIGFIAPTENDSYIVLPFELLEQDEDDKDPVIRFAIEAKMRIAKRSAIKLSQLPVEEKKLFVIQKKDWE